jgi:lysozyme
MTASQTFDTAAMVAILIAEEAERYFVYDDKTGDPIRSGSVVQGNPTVGIGRNLSSEGLTDAECRYLCANDIATKSAALDQAIPWWRSLSVNRQYAILDLAFNLGVGGLVNGWPHFLADMQAGDWSGAANELETSEWWGQVGTRGPRITARILAG